MSFAIRMKLIASASALVWLAAPVLAEDKVSRIDVNAEFGTALDEGSIAYFETIEADLIAAIGERVHMTDPGEGLIVRVAVRKLLADSVELMPLTHEFDAVSGVVAVASPDGSTTIESFPVAVAAAADDAMVPEGHDIVEPSEAQMYDALIWGFADLVARNLARINPALVPEEHR